MSSAPCKIGNVLHEQRDVELFFDLLHAVHQLLTIINNVKTKLDEFFCPGSQKQLSDEQRAEFIKALISHLAFTTNKMINTIPDLNSVSQEEESTLLRDFLLQEACCLREIVYTFVDSAQKKQDIDINEYINQQAIKQTSVELDEILAHMEQTVILLKSNPPNSEVMISFLTKIDKITQLVDELIDTILDAQNAEETVRATEKLKETSTVLFEEILIQLQNHEASGRREKAENSEDEILKELQSIVVFVLDEMDVIAKNLTHDPIYSEQQAQNVSKQIRSSFFVVLCDLQCKLMGYRLKMESKKQEVVEIKPARKTNSLPHMELSEIEDLTPKTKKRKLFSIRKKKNTSLKSIKRGDTDSDLICSGNAVRLQKMKSSSLPATDNPSFIDEKVHQEIRKETQQKPIEPPSKPSNTPITKVQSEEKAKARLSASFSKDTKLEASEEELAPKRPKISRMVSKSKIFNMEHKDVDTPERRLAKGILQILEEELPWFKEKFDVEHGTKTFRINTKIEELIKKDLVSYGNKVRGPIPSITRGRGAASPREKEREKDLNQFVSHEVLNSESWRGLFTSTSTLLSPLEVPRLRACVTPMGKAANELIAVAFNMVDNPSDRSLLPKLSSCVGDYYQKLLQVVKICIEGPERMNTISFLEKPLEALINEAPVNGEVNQELVNTTGEEYKLQMISGKVRQLVYYTANSFRALVIQIGSTINSIVESSGSISATLVVQLVANITSQLSQIRQFLDNVVTSREFSLMIKSMEAPRDDTKRKELTASMYGENIWNASPIENNPDENLGTLNSFVLRLTQTENEFDNYFMKAFLATYQSFTSPLQLFSKLMERYYAPPTVDEFIANKVRLRVVIVLKYWIETQFYDINDQLLEKITCFLSTIKQGGQKLIAGQLENLLEEKAEDRRISIRKIELGELPALDTNQLYDINPVSPAHVLFTSDPLDIAKQITMQESSIFHAIELSELLNQAWCKPALRYQSPNVLRFIHSLNKLSFWVATSILWYDETSTRSKVVEKFIIIARHLRKLGNFNSLMGILGGLNLVCISRLKQTLASVSEKLNKEFKQLNETLMTPKASWKEYREALQSQALPRLPYLGVHLSDLAFIGDGNASIVNGLLNFDKHLMVYKVLEQILICQQQRYEYQQAEPLRTFFSELPALGEDELWHLSKMREPKA